MTSDMLSPDELAAIKQQKETEPMEPEPTTHTVATNDLPAKFRECASASRKLSTSVHLRARAAVYDRCADELEAVLRAEAKAHEETARELAAWLYGYVEVARQMVTDPKVVEEIAATLANVRRATLRDAWQVCPVTGEAHEWSRIGGATYTHANRPYCFKCGVYEPAVSPADVKEPEQ